MHMLRTDLYPSGVGTEGMLLVRSHDTTCGGLENNQTSDVEALILKKACSRPGDPHPFRAYRPAR